MSGYFGLTGEQVLFHFCGRRCELLIKCCRKIRENALNGMDMTGKWIAEREETCYNIAGKPGGLRKEY